MIEKTIFKPSKPREVYTIMRITKTFLDSGSKTDLLKMNFDKNLERVLLKAEEEGIFPDNYKTIDVIIKIKEDLK